VATFLWKDSGADFDNGGFDDGGFQLGGGSLDAWTTFNNTTGNVSAAAEAVLSGDKSLKLFGQFTGSSNTSGIWQGITVKPGDLVEANLSAFVRSADTLSATSNSAQMKIEFYNQYGGSVGAGNFLSANQALVADTSTANNVWNARELSGIAPAGAVEARLVLQFVQPNNQFGAVHIDDVSFAVLLHAAERGDYDANGVVDQADYLVWQATFGSNTQLGADGNGDGIIDSADYVVWRNNFEVAASATASDSIVPEPVGLPLLIGVVVGMIQAVVRPNRKRTAHHIRLERE
jgi:hypothetical protein